MVPTENATYRIDYIQKLSLAEVVPVRDSFSDNKEIEQMSKHQDQGKIVLLLVVLLHGETWQWIVPMNCAIYL